MAVIRPDGFRRVVRNIENAQFRSLFDQELEAMRSWAGVGVISDTDSQPLHVSSHLGEYVIVTVGVVKNLDELMRSVFNRRRIHFAELSDGEVSPTELVAALINQEESLEAGVANAQEAVRGSCSLLVLTRKGLLAARDKWGRTPVIIGRKPGSFAVTMETCAFPNLGYEVDKELGPGEIVFITPEGYEQRRPPERRLQICSFLWVYYGYPASNYEGVNVESVRYRCGGFLARRNPIDIDFVAGIPDSGVGHGLGYAAEAGVPYQRPFVKYTPTWARSFMPQNKEARDLVARMKLIPIRDLIAGKRFLFCEDSIVRGTQLRDTVQRLFDVGAVEVHMRPACPPLAYNCKFLNFSVSKSEWELAARSAIRDLAGDNLSDISAYTRWGTAEYQAVEDIIRRKLNLTTLKYQRLEDLVSAIGLPKERLCTYCWDGVEPAS
jgi:amidophosphoribosyltransferase